ncbi:MAG: hypothetical protein GY943_14730 [Chloroflexi bacterium]|nr:hypothetical protein [Chloroflexota bacterium]
MNSRPYSFRFGHILAICAGLFLFFIASLQSSGPKTGPFVIGAVLFLIIAAGCYFGFAHSEYKGQIGLGLMINGIAFWGIGWLILLFIDPKMGWWIYVVGWAILSLGLITYGANDIRKNGWPTWFILPLLLGTLPVLATIASPYHFVNGIEPINQLLTMFAYAFGWVLCGMAYSPELFKKKSTIKQTAQILQSTPTD